MNFPANAAPIALANSPSSRYTIRHQLVNAAHKHIVHNSEIFSAWPRALRASPRTLARCECCNALPDRVAHLTQQFWFVRRSRPA
jgi:hypothetical protein